MYAPLYHARAPSVRNVFHKQSIGFEYSAPTILPFGNLMVGWLYIRVRASRGWRCERAWQAGELSGYSPYQPAA